MCHKLILCQDIAAALHEILTDDWFFSYTDEIVTEAAHKLEPGKLKSTVAVVTAIMQAHPFTQWDDEGTNGYRALFNDICDLVDPILNDYAKFCARQMVLEPIASVRRTKTRRKTMPLTRDQRKAVDRYEESLAHINAVYGRNFPANVIDLVQYRAMRT